MTLPLFDAPSTKDAPISIGSMSLGIIGEIARTDDAPDAENRIESARIVRTVEPTGHPLDVDGWRAPVIGDTLWHDAGRLPSGDGFTYWLACEL